MTLAGHDSLPPPLPRPVLALDYRTPAAKLSTPQRPDLLTTFGILSIDYGFLGVVLNLIVLACSLYGPGGSSSVSRRFDLTVLFEIEASLSVAAAFWLVVAGIWIFAATGAISRRPRQMLILYVFAKLLLAMFYAALFIAGDLNFPGHAPTLIWLKDGLFWLLMTAAFPLALLLVLRSESLSAYYGAAPDARSQ